MRDIKAASVFILICAILIAGGWFSGYWHAMDQAPPVTVDVIEDADADGYEDCHTHLTAQNAFNHANEVADNANEFTLQRVVVGAIEILHCEAN